MLGQGLGNFGCGSSREHAPWALVAGGFRAIVSLPGDGIGPEVFPAEVPD